MSCLLISSDIFEHITFLALSQFVLSEVYVDGFILNEAKHTLCTQYCTFSSSFSLQSTKTKNVGRKCMKGKLEELSRRMITKKKERKQTLIYQMHPLQK